jgi:hypothetical protein
VFPQSAAFAFDSCTLAGCGNVLARKPARNHVNKTPPSQSVKGAYIIPDREWGQASVVLPGDQNIPCIRVVFDGADNPVPKQDASENPAAASREQGEFSKF